MTEPLLVPEQILNDAAVKEIQTFFKRLPVLQRGRWRWVFPEPNSSLSYPRQRARREIEEGADWLTAETLSQDDGLVAMHNKTAPVFQVSPQAARDWAAFALTTTNKLHDMVPPVPSDSPTSLASVSVWLAMIKLAHNEGLIRPGGGMEIIRKWSAKSSQRQRDALSNILLLLQDHMVFARGGQSETKIKFGPKAIQPRQPASAGMSTLGRPSTAPIVSAAQQKLEARIKAESDKAVERANKMMEEKAKRVRVYAHVCPCVLVLQRVCLCQRERRVCACGAAPSCVRIMVGTKIR